MGGGGLIWRGLVRHTPGGGADGALKGPLGEPAGAPAAVVAGEAREGPQGLQLAVCLVRWERGPPQEFGGTGETGSRLLPDPDGSPSIRACARARGAIYDKGGKQKSLILLV